MGRGDVGTREHRDAGTQGCQDAEGGGTCEKPTVIWTLVETCAWRKRRLILKRTYSEHHHCICACVRAFESSCTCSHHMATNRYWQHAPQQEGNPYAHWQPGAQHAANELLGHIRMFTLGASSSQSRGGSCHASTWPHNMLLDCFLVRQHSN